MPTAQRALAVGINQPHRTFTRSLRLNGQMCGQHGLATSAFLRSNDYCFHENNLSARAAFMKYIINILNFEYFVVAPTVGSG
jgi:hypothetical protein